MPKAILSRERSQRFPIEGEYDPVSSAEMKVPQTIKKPKKRVSFRDFVTVRATLHTNNMSDKEISSCWYNYREMCIIKRSVIYQLKRMIDGKPLAKEFFTPRGLECRTKEGREKRRTSEVNSINAVLDEQELQQMKGLTFNPQSIREVYLEHSVRCLHVAQKLGRCDEIEANRIHKEYDHNNKGNIDQTNNNTDSTSSSFSWQQEKNLERKSMNRRKSRKVSKKKYPLYCQSISSEEVIIRRD
eukprot:CAMPEP_0194132078 /NCGR_PEP_ID=MMETSP0152-20130528/2630_1 /TAXON_ID=1049557 /ORGANISM="Thalassiothrix antarctica, Strain L6-D1" /LENGTH=242 /DNA_ID=CAMNT_0038827003 /DNA_START=104 /DNA_END=832 /DNA_ORIENTATION=+